MVHLLNEKMKKNYIYGGYNLLVEVTLNHTVERRLNGARIHLIHAVCDELNFESESGVDTDGLKEEIERKIKAFKAEVDKEYSRSKEEKILESMGFTK